jgi:hypothetical protein
MKKNFKLYFVAWGVLLALFNVISFVIPGERTASFWIGYSLISLAFIGQLACSYKAFRGDSAKRLFYSISLIQTSYIGLFASFVIGGLCMIISPLPHCIGVVACAVVLAFNLLAILKSAAATGEVERLDAKVKTQTSFIKALTVDADALIASAKSEALKAECKKVYEAIRYSDPMSNEALASVESKITEKLAEFSEVVKADDAEKVTEVANEVVILVEDRNKKCKAAK